MTLKSLSSFIGKKRLTLIEVCKHQIKTHYHDILQIKENRFVKKIDLFHNSFFFFPIQWNEISFSCRSDSHANVKALECSTNQSRWTWQNPSLSLSKKMTSPHMVAVIDLSLESDGWLRGGNGEGICTEQQQSAGVMFSMANLIQSRGWMCQWSGCF